MGSTPQRSLLAILALLVILLGSSFALGLFDGASPTIAETNTELKNTEQATAPELAGQAAGDVTDDSEIKRTGIEDTTSSSSEKVSTADKLPSPKTIEAAAHIHGRVINAAGLGVRDAKIILRSSGKESPKDKIEGMFGLSDLDDDSTAAATTDEQGTFDLPIDALGPFHLIVKHSNHPSAEYRGTASDSRVDGVIITVREGASLSGTVTDAPEGVLKLKITAKKVESSSILNPVDLAFDMSGLVEGLGMATSDRSVELSEDRSFHIEGLDPDASYKIQGVHAEDGIEGLKPASKCTELMVVRAGTQGIQLRWREPLTIALRVVDATDLRVIESMRVSAGLVHELKMLGMGVPFSTRHPLNQRKFPDGLVLISNLGTSDKGKQVVAVELRAPGYHSWIREDIEVPQAGHVDLGTIHLDRATVVRIQVLSALSRNPIANARVELSAWKPPEDNKKDGALSFNTKVKASTSDGKTSSDMSIDTGSDRPGMNAKTDAEGWCEITAEFAGPATVQVKADNYAVLESAQFDVPSSGSLTQRLELTKGGRAIITVRDPKGQLVTSASVIRIGPVASDKQTFFVDKNGKVAFERLTPGLHHFKLASKASSGLPDGMNIDLGSILDARLDSTALEVSEGSTAELELIEPLRGSLRGTITLDGEPLDAAKIRIVIANSKSNGLKNRAMQMAESMFGGMIGESLPGRASTNDDGEFELKDIVAVDSILTISHKRLAMPFTSTVTLVEGENHHDIAIQTTTLSGTVTSSNGKALRSAKVSVRVDDRVLSDSKAAEFDQASELISGMFGGTQSRGIRTDSEGHFELTGVNPNAKLVLTISGRMHTAKTIRIDPLLEGEHRTGTDVKLEGAGRVRVSAKRIAGIMGADAIWAEPVPTNSEAPHTVHGLLKAGRTTLDGLKPGRWRIQLNGPKTTEGAHEQFVLVVEGKTQRVDF